MSKLYFNPEYGSLCEPRNKWLPPPDAEPLNSLLADNEFAYVSGDYKVLKPRDCMPDEVIMLGRLVTDALADLDPPAPFSREVVRRLYVLGVFPNFNYVRDTFGSLGNFVEKIGATPSRGPNTTVSPSARFDRLSHAELLEYVAECYTDQWDDGIARCPATKANLHNLFVGGQLPNISYIQRRLGGVSKVNAFLGFPDIAAWQDRDYIDYGVAVLKYNGENSLTTSNADLLAKAYLGPYSSGIKVRFGSWGNYKNIVQAYAKKSELEGKTKETLPVSALQVRQYALRQLLHHYIPAAEPSTLATSAEHTISDVTERILAANPTLVLADIEIFAITAHIFDDIWTVKNVQRLPIIPAKS